MFYIKNSVVKTLRELKVMHPNISFAANTPAFLGWADYTPPPPTLSPTEIAREAAYAQLEIDRTNTLAYAKLTALSNMTPAQIQTWIDANVTNLATATDALKTLAVGLSILIRRERISRI